MNPAIFALLYQSALGSIRRDGNSADWNEIANRLKSMVPGLQNVNPATWYNIVRSAFNANAQANALSDASTTNLPVSSYPIDRTIPAGADRFAYRVDVSWVDGQGRRDSTQVIVRSPVQLPAEDVWAQAISDVMNHVQETGTNPKDGRGQSGYRAEIVSAGRSY